MLKHWKKRVWGAAALWVVVTAAVPVHAGPIVDWFRNMHSPPKPPCASGTCAKPAACTAPGGCAPATPNTYYPGAPAAIPGATGIPGATAVPPAAPTVVPGAVTYGAPGTMVQPGTMPPRYVQPGVGASTIPPPGTVFPNSVTPPPAYPPRTTNYPPTTSYPLPGYSTTAAPIGATSSPVAQAAYFAPSGTVAAPVMPVANCPNCARPAAPVNAAPGLAMPQTVHYAPYTAYRTNWVQVPVTVYRPITAIDPATGRPITVVQPCTATAWQVQRVPMHGQPFLSRYQPLPVSNPTGAVVGAPMAMPAGAVPLAAPAGNCPTGVCPQPSAPIGSGVIPMAPTTALPASPPTTLAPSTTLEPRAGVAPSPPTTQPPSYLGSPARVAPPPSGAVPADQRPTLQPGEGAAPGVYNYPPQRDPYSNIPPYIPPPPPPPPSSPSSPPPPAAARSQPETRFEPNVNVPTTSGASRSFQPTVPTARPATPIKPLPDPDAEERDDVDRSTPRLIVPQERTAASRGMQPVHRVVPAPSPARVAPVADKTWDASGWKAARP
ncbi:MAG: hypothetical protein U0939_08135 [Pirellulales bacterium]